MSIFFGLSAFTLVASSAPSEHMRVAELAAIYQPYVDCIEANRHTIDENDPDSWTKAEALDELCGREATEKEVRTRLLLKNPHVSEDKLERILDRFLTAFLLMNLELLEAHQEMPREESE